MEIAAQTQRENRSAEADQNRIVRATRVEEQPARPWRGRLAFNAIRRLAHAGTPA